MTYIYLYPNYNLAKIACKEFFERHKDNATIRFPELSISIDEDIHRFITVPVTMQRENIMGMAGICDVSAIVQKLNSLKSLIIAEGEFMKERANIINARKEK